MPGVWRRKGRLRNGRDLTAVTLLALNAVHLTFEILCRRKYYIRIMYGFFGFAELKQRYSLVDMAMRQEVTDIKVLAQKYCDLIDSSTADDYSWLREVASLLPRLHAAIQSLQTPRHNGTAVLCRDLDARFELYMHLVELLGDRNPYWLEFDGFDGTHVMTGSLADDLTDIYYELKSGLLKADLDREGSSHCWQHGFDTHWGRHLADATRHLSDLHARGRLD